MPKLISHAIRFVSRAAVWACMAILASLSRSPGAEPPNIVFILADDLGHGELGCFGQKEIKTPHLDRMAAEGMKLTNFYSGSTVCAPSRCVLMTGQHVGRARVRGNARLPLRPEDETVAELLKKAGYATALCGKWGLGQEGGPGVPTRQGFDFFYGYLDQLHAHNYYPTFLYRNDQRVSLRNVPDHADENDAGWAKERVDYSPDLILQEALRWLEQAHRQPFFLYFAPTLPHTNNERRAALGDGQEVPDYGEYEGKPWPNPDKGQAAMVSRLDRHVGQLLAKLKELGVDERTLVLFSSDNGHHREGGNDPDRFDANGPFRGMKRSHYDGGIRVTALARWPGKIAPGSSSDHLAYFGDFMATACELTGHPLPDDRWSISFLPTLLGRPEEQKKHPYLYWEFYELGGSQALRFEQWKALRAPMKDGPIALHDLAKDVGESTDVAAANPDIVAKTKAFFEEAHRPDPNWTVQPAKATSNR